MAAEPIETVNGLSGQYARVLANYLRTRGEDALYRISLLSRQFVEDGFDPDELVGIHVQALEQLTGAMDEAQKAQAGLDAHHVLVELMTAFGIQSRELLERRLSERTRAAEVRASQERHQARRALARSRELEALAAERAAVLGQIAEGVVVADPRGRITYVNEAAGRLHGAPMTGVTLAAYSRTFGLRTMAGEPYPPDELPLARAVLRGETVRAARWRIHRPDGSEIVAEGSASPVVLEDGTRYGSVLVLHDATERHALEQEKDSFLSSVSHDLKNPLTAILGTAQLLQRRLRTGKVGPAQAAEQLVTVEHAAAQMVEQLDSILDVARVRLGRPLDLVRQTVDLVALARHVVAAHRAASEHHRLSVRSAQDQILGQWDGMRLRRVLNNLLGNAVRYSPGGGHITVDLAVQDGTAVLTVADEGVGIPAEDRPHVFERFRRGSNVEGRIAGTGIGLADVLQVVEQHGGTVTVESEVGRGSTFTVRLPLDLPGGPGTPSGPG